jgi:hypothetical protein
MRTTVNLDEDVAAAVRRLQRERSMGVSEALNQIARSGLAVRPKRRQFRQRTFAGTLLIDVANVQEALDIAEGPMRR